ncbi:putative riboflavin kinase [Rosa chinensis]|uniref:riboflavin kinase n=1 Tax=Rosa chinensis TaxID=74649 RepID=A0A2P6Q3K2_ROSCH|nr:putative riboflavin kinase [Rosa chinensis]
MVLKMFIAEPLKKLVSCVILDLDGTLLHTVYLGKYGKKWDGKEIQEIVGKTPLEAATAVVEDYGLSCTTSERITLRAGPNVLKSVINFCTYFQTPIVSRYFHCKWLMAFCQLSLYVVQHQSASRFQSANTTFEWSQSANNIGFKLTKGKDRNQNFFSSGWKESFLVIIGGDEVRSGKPSPEILLEAAKRLNIEPSSCLVIEDSLPGVTASKAAGMEVVVVPSLPKQSHLYTSADEVINSLLDLHPEKWGLPPLKDWIKNTLLIEPGQIGGPVVKGFRQGSKVVGIPTANLSTKQYSTLLFEHPSGVYFGLAGLPTCCVFKMVMNVCWNPYFNNTEKTIEPWLLHDFDEDFYGEELLLVIVGYIWPEANFPALGSLTEMIHEDRKIAEEALDLPMHSKFKDDPYLKSPHKDAPEISQILLILLHWLIANGV